MVFNFFGSVLEVKSLDLLVLLEFQSGRKDSEGNLQLKSLRFFKDKSSLAKYWERESLERIPIAHTRTNIDMEGVSILKNHIKEYSQGKKVDLAEISRGLNFLKINALFPTEFSKKVIRYLINNVKYGETVSYSDIGNGIGSRAYQAIGTVLKNNPLPLIIPCHRVIRKDGTIGGFMGKTQQNRGWEINLKKRLIKLET